ncbi:TetR/AcrR family transcriptional regulator [Trinickia mobilis]|uniref:TetR/AcrR family transcriptional regulator n=1 Tax=Trinickia mobilis TaxID=2816356 RepID=UPI001F5C21C6|nr:TetR/AcrR family transcriptional regulator [Trinickia mobilis]
MVAAMRHWQRAMRKSRQEAAQTRQRIVDAASVEFRRKGIGGAALSDVMSAAGLTHGGFYKHFESKDQVIEESVSQAIQSLIDGVEAAASGGRGPAAVISGYLSTKHRDDPGSGCPFVALGSELARSAANVREATTEGFSKLVEAMAAQFDDLPAAAAKKKALVTLSTMIGAVTIARIVTDPKLSASILLEARKRLTTE